MKISLQTYLQEGNCWKKVFMDLEKKKKKGQNRLLTSVDGECHY